MRALLALALAIVPFSAMSADQPSVPRVHLENMPAEFMGRWAASKDQFTTGGESWLTIGRLHLTSPEEWSFIASAWRIGPNYLELDLSWRSGNGPPKGRYTRRYLLSQDRHTITDTSNGTVRGKCDD
jgi:hypothetical protein